MPAVKHAPACFAPPLSDEKLAEYGILIATVAGGTQLREVLDNLLACCMAWWELPESGRTDGEILRVLHGGKTLDLKTRPLEDDHATALDPHLPWDDELVSYGKLLDGISPTAQKPLRNAAFHLLWHVVEMARGREPMTSDVLR